MLPDCAFFPVYPVKCILCFMLGHLMASCLPSEKLKFDYLKNEKRFRNEMRQTKLCHPPSITIYYDTPPPTTIQNISTTIYHQPKYVHHHPPPSNASQIYPPPPTFICHHPPPAKIYPPPPTMTHHHPPPAKICPHHPPRPTNICQKLTTSQNISTTTHHQPKYIYPYLPVPKKWTTTMQKPKYIHILPPLDITLTVFFLRNALFLSVMEILCNKVLVSLFFKFYFTIFKSF